MGGDVCIHFGVCDVTCAYGTCKGHVCVGICVCVCGGEFVCECVCLCVYRICVEEGFLLQRPV
jgi:hypothetical protein